MLRRTGRSLVYPHNKISFFKGFYSSPEIIRLAVMLWVCYPLSLINIEDTLHEHGFDICREIVRFWWNRCGSMFTAEICRKRMQRLLSYSNRQWHLDAVFVRRSKAKRTISGAPWIMKAKCLKPVKPTSQIAGRH